MKPLLNSTQTFKTEFHTLFFKWYINSTVKVLIKFHHHFLHNILSHVSIKTQQTAISET